MLHPQLAEHLIGLRGDVLGTDLGRFGDHVVGVPDHRQRGVEHCGEPVADVLDPLGELDVEVHLELPAAAQQLFVGRLPRRPS